ncbi:MAG: LEPR-XLL domain-containing protein, partial [Candidatus Peribacter sp.]|nr:LEPR-XLL domain-containing protein [Candidatus Peribacter sp.]
MESYTVKKRSTPFAQKTGCLLRFERLEQRMLLSVDWGRVWIRAEATSIVTDAWVPVEGHGKFTFGDTDNDGL